MRAASPDPSVSSPSTGGRSAPAVGGSGTVWRVRTRGEFAVLRATGRTVRRGPIAVRHALLPDPPDPSDPPDPPRVAYAIGRAVGSAVVRNRIRRRLRHLVSRLASEGRIPQGISLIMVTPDIIELDADQLDGHVRAAFTACVAGRAPGGAPRRGPERSS